MSKPDISVQRKKEIVTAAITVFSQEGFYQARMDDIAQAAGLSKGTLYLYFKDKDALIIAIAETIFRQDVVELDLARRLSGTAVEKLETFLQLFIAEMEQTNAIMPIVYEFYAMSIRREDVRLLLKDYLNTSIAILETIIQQGIDAGDLLPTDANKAAFTFGALLEGVFVQSFYADTKDVAERFMSGLTLLLDGLRAN